LHGSGALRHPRRSRDENVFAIKQGVALGVFVRRPGARGEAKVWHAEMIGPRQEKLARLAEESATTTPFSALDPRPDRFFFVPRRLAAEAEYAAFVGLPEIFPAHQNGLKTDRDELFFDFDREALLSRMRAFYADGALTPAERERLRVFDTSSYKLLARREK